ncbi:MAG: SusD/RagB family nutrient-binding outer membrane lipoprotein [Chitinophagaceae bacterium]|nr:SusD/RagB family nutrient-binding outer membrane lipoprotein [Chitinophagaceae bacterium]
MKNKLLSFFLMIVIAVISNISCNKKLDEAYRNPNAQTVQPVENILPSVIGAMLGYSSAAGSGYGLGGDGIIIGRYIQYWNNYTLTTSDNGGTQYDKMGGTIGGSDALGSVWAMFYYGQGANLNRVIDYGTAQQKWDYVGVAQAIRAWGWLELTNQYNNVILREAFDASRQQFDYQDQTEVYDTVRATCFRALANLNRTDGSVSPSNLAIGDAFMNGGDVNKWKKFVYGVLARSYAYLSDKSTYKADSVIYYCNLAMTSNADNSTLKFAALQTSGTSNYYGPYRGNMGSPRQSAYISNLMSGRNTTAFVGVNDPRTWYMLRENTDSTFYGVTPGVEGTTSLSANLRPQNFWGNPFSSTGAPTTEQGRYIFRDKAEFPVMTASEMQFLKAEAAFRKGDKSMAIAAYRLGISLNFDMLAANYSTNVPPSKLITSTVRDNFLANPAVVPAMDNNITLTQIMLQKYIALFGWGMNDTWVDMRRYHYMDIDPLTGKQVYADFVPAGGGYYINNNGKPVYRARPRYNSEYLYDIPALTLIGGLDLDYHTKQPWFSQP